MDALVRALPPETPVYNAVLGNMVDFGDQNLAVFVRFYAFYADVVRELPSLRGGDCVQTPADAPRYIASRQELGLSFYKIITDDYRTIGVVEAAGSEQAAAESAVEEKAAHNP